MRQKWRPWAGVSAHRPVSCRPAATRKYITGRPDQETTQHVPPVAAAPEADRTSCRRQQGCLVCHVSRSQQRPGLCAGLPGQRCTAEPRGQFRSVHKPIGQHSVYTSRGRAITADLAGPWNGTRRSRRGPAPPPRGHAAGHGLTADAAGQSVSRSRRRCITPRYTSQMNRRHRVLTHPTIVCNYELAVE